MDKNGKNQLIADAFRYFKQGIKSGRTNLPKEFLKQIGLDYKILGIGYNSGQFHHRKSKEFKNAYEATGILIKSKCPVNRESSNAYSCWGTNSIVFQLNDIENSVVNMLAICINQSSVEEQYLNDDGLYPGFPDVLTRRLYITNTAIDAASLIQSKLLKTEEAVISLIDGKLYAQHVKAIQRLTQLSEICIFAGSDVGEVKNQLDKIINTPVIVVINHAENLSINEVLIKYGRDELFNWIVRETEKRITANGKKLVFKSKNKIIFKGNEAIYEILGQIPPDYSNLEINLNIIVNETQYKHRLKLNLYDNSDIETKINRISQKDCLIRTDRIEDDLAELTRLLDSYRDERFDQEDSPALSQSVYNELTPNAEKLAIEFLSRPNLTERLGELLCDCGIVGENNAKLNLFIIASSYKMPYPLHCLLQGKSGMGKSHLINSVAECIPMEDVINITRVTSKSLYYYSSGELINKLIIFQDVLGMDNNVLFALRELQSAGFISSSTLSKDIYGNKKAIIKVVKAHFASLIATTKAELYYDNMSRCIILGIDESEGQTEKIVDYQNNKISGLIDVESEEKAKLLLRNCIRVLKSFEVVNPFAHLIKIPTEVKMQRRLHLQFHNYIAQITILHQYQRRRDKKGRLIATLEDVTESLETFFPALFLKVDELDSSSRQFFERLKLYVASKDKGNSAKFRMREIQDNLNESRTQVFHYLKVLRNLDYVRVVEGSANRGFVFQICFWDDVVRLKNLIQSELKKQVIECV